MVSSLEDKPGASKQASFRGSGPLKKSLDSSSTSVWGTSTGKAPKSGQSHPDSQASSELQTCWSVCDAVIAAVVPGRSDRSRNRKHAEEQPVLFQ